MTAKPVKLRVADLRDRRKAEGLKRLEVWAPPAQHERIRAYVQRLLRAWDKQAK